MRILECLIMDMFIKLVIFYTQDVQNREQINM